MKKHIIFVRCMNCDNCVKKISDKLNNRNLDYEVKLEEGSVVVTGDNDDIRAARNAILEAGYEVL